MNDIIYTLLGLFLVGATLYFALFVFQAALMAFITVVYAIVFAFKWIINLVIGNKQ